MVEATRALMWHGTRGEEESGMTRKVGDLMMKLCPEGRGTRDSGCHDEFLGYQLARHACAVFALWCRCPSGMLKLIFLFEGLPITAIIVTVLGGMLPT